MHAWAMTHESEQRADSSAGRVAASQAVRLVAISREAGTRGEEIGQGVAERLGWEFFGKNIVDQVAERFRLCRRMLDLVDETHPNWVYDVLGTWMDRQLVPHGKFVCCLTKIMQAAARHGQAVFVGRGAQFFLPRKGLLAVRLIAGLQYRVRNVMTARQLSEAEAKRHCAEIDEGRRRFVEQFFHHDITDPHFYDLVINVEHCGTAGAIDEILAAVASQPSAPVAMPPVLA
jgi:hypothetical protein